MNTKLAHYFLNQTERIFLPVGIYGGLSKSGYSVSQTVSSADIQYEVSVAMQERYNTPAFLTGMDLSVEAEAFDCQIRFSEMEVPTVIGRRVSTVEEIAGLEIPRVGAGRTNIYLDAARRLAVVGKEKGIPVLGGMIGPFTLAGRIFGVSESMELSAMDPEGLIALLERVTPFLIQYAQAFKDAGTDGVIMAEPAAGLLSPRSLGKFSSAYIHQIIQAVQDENFTIVYHNCGAKLVHLNKILEAGSEIYHFGDPMDLPAALAQVEGKVILAGNLDPSGVFTEGEPQNAFERTTKLLEFTRSYKNYFLSSGCEIPPNARDDLICACYQATEDYNKSR